MKKVLITIAICTMYLNSIAQTFEPQPEFFRTKREMPLVSLSTTQEVYVSSYGAVINDGVDDLTAIQNAIDAAIALSSQANPVRLVFEQGTYDMMPASGTHSLTVADAQYMVIDGQGAKIRIHNPQIGFTYMLRCTNVIVKDLYIDYAVLPFTQGVVTAKDETNNTFDLLIDEGFPLLSEAYFTSAPQKWGMVIDSTSKLIKTGARNLFPYRGWTHISGNTFRIQQPSNYLPQIDVGDYFVQIARNNGKTIFRTSAGKNVTYLNITSYASPAGSYNGNDNYEFNIINCKIIPKPGRLISANADCIHITGSYFGPWIEGCLFEGHCDDVMNLKHASRTILSVEGPKVLTVKHEVDLTDVLNIYNPRDGVLLGTFSVTNAVRVEDNVFRITLSGEHNVTVTGGHQTADKCYLTTRSCESFIIRNNTFKNARRYGLLLQASYGQVKGCSFENLSTGGIHLENGVDWGEGFSSNNIEITKNTFIGCGYDQTYLNDPHAAAIVSRQAKLRTPCSETDKWCGVETSEWQGIENITIKGNYIEYNKTGLHLQNINGLIITDNEIVHNTNDPYTGEATSRYISNCTFSVTGVTADPTTISLKPAETAQINATITPTYATNTDVIWASNNALVATVDDSGLVTTVAAGTATISVITYDGLYTATCEVTVSTNGTGVINSNHSLKSVSIFPNPTNGILNIHTGKEYDNTVANIVDLSGRVLIREQLPGVENTIDLSMLNKDTYIMYLEERNNLITKQKIVKF